MATISLRIKTSPAGESRSRCWREMMCESRFAGARFPCKTGSDVASLGAGRLLVVRQAAKEGSTDALRRPPSPRVERFVLHGSAGFQLRQRCIPHISRRSPPEPPAHARESLYRKGRKTLLTGESPPIPAQPASAKTGLSRRRSRVRVPSLPFSETRLWCGFARLGQGRAPLGLAVRRAADSPRESRCRADVLLIFCGGENPHSPERRCRDQRQRAS